MNKSYFYFCITMLNITTLSTCMENPMNDPIYARMYNLTLETSRKICAGQNLIYSYFDPDTGNFTIALPEHARTSSDPKRNTKFSLKKETIEFETPYAFYCAPNPSGPGVVAVYNSKLFVNNKEILPYHRK